MGGLEEATAMPSPPFSQHLSSGPELKPLRVIHPATVAVGDELVRPIDDMNAYLEGELIPTKLDRVYRHLHYAGAPRFARPLHRQKLMGRDVVITENVSEHLIWHRAKIFIKPLSSYLLDYKFWVDHLCCGSEALHKSACGFLLSYIWLVSRESDFQLARDEMCLLPKDLEWEYWVAFAEDFTRKVDTKHLGQVARRYQYGELRLSRLNRIYRYSPLVFSGRNLFRGFLSPSIWYAELFRQNFGWLLGAFAFFSVSLSGLQVALATEQLGSNADFHRASYGFAVFSLVAVTASIVAMILTWFILALYFYVSAKVYHRRVQAERRKAWNNEVL
ncbi:hypothetical protein B0T16DRAFT_423090 [Cercophora newfieldiana]|uniref:Subtilisin-like serine protease n=1 Tax=Cercophora newfieldiana TaxID=92897 RepID=A0AA40CJH2_9PEZI|nr:hypothetical protein B0T16DRAFT_423090 [Cercophora newfieldiana]